MKLLMVYASRVSYTPTVKTIDWAEDKTEPEHYEDILIAFIHAEEKDMEDIKAAETRLIKNVKWGARKNNTRRVLLHSFAHLSESKATPEFTKELLDRAEARLKNAGYEAYQSPFGYFLDISMDWPGRSLARVFKDL